MGSGEWIRDPKHSAGVEEAFPSSRCEEVRTQGRGHRQIHHGHSVRLIISQFFFFFFLFLISHYLIISFSIFSSSHLISSFPHFLISSFPHFLISSFPHF